MVSKQLDGKEWYDKQLLFSPVCAYCKHLKETSERKCEAFDKIPFEIWSGKNNHKNPYPGDHGIRFERV